MTGNPAVIAQLNKALQRELTAINQYFLHAKMQQDWGYLRLAKQVRKISIVEMFHAEWLMERILFLESTPSMEPLSLKVGSNVKQQMKSDLQMEVDSVAQYNGAVRVAREAGDGGSRELFEKLLGEAEEHVNWLEAQLHQIEEIGYERYLMKLLEKED